VALLNHLQEKDQKMPDETPTPKPVTVVVNGGYAQRPRVRTSHGFHLIMSLVTFGLWIPVWITVGVYHAIQNGSEGY
jgi:hypothetical protein